MTKRDCKSVARLTQNNACHERHIKVNHFHYLHKLKDDPVGAGRPVPWIQMKGHWLKEVGFEIDTPVKIRVMEGCLVLTVELRIPAKMNTHSGGR